MDRFEQKEMKKNGPIKNIWYDWLINHATNPITKIVAGFKDKAISLFKTKTPEEYGKQVKPYLKDVITDLQEYDVRKV